MKAELNIRPMRKSEIPRFYAHISEDFIPGEYPPLDILEDHLKKGAQEGLVFSRDGTDLAYATAAVGKNGFVLISLLAVFPGCRGSGTGSSFVGAIAQRYGDKKGIVVEVEKPETAEDEKTEEERIRRISFYEKLGFHLVRDIEYSIWGIPLHLMVRPLKADAQQMESDIGPIIRELYLGLMGENLMHRLIFKKKV